MDPRFSATLKDGPAAKFGGRGDDSVCCSPRGTTSYISRTWTQQQEKSAKVELLFYSLDFVSLSFKAFAKS